MTQGNLGLYISKVISEKLNGKLDLVKLRDSKYHFDLHVECKIGHLVKSFSFKKTSEESLNVSQKGNVSIVR